MMHSTGMVRRGSTPQDYRYCKKEGASVNRLLDQRNLLQQFL